MKNNLLKIVFNLGELNTVHSITIKIYINTVYSLHSRHERTYSLHRETFQTLLSYFGEKTFKMKTKETLLSLWGGRKNSHSYSYHYNVNGPFVFYISHSIHLLK